MNKEELITEQETGDCLGTNDHDLITLNRKTGPTNNAYMLCL